MRNFSEMQQTTLSNRPISSIERPAWHKATVWLGGAAFPTLIWALLAFAAGANLAT